MAALVMVFALTAALSIGYGLGRLSGPVRSRRQPWRPRTSRVELGRLAISMVAVLAARRVQRFAGLAPKKRLQFLR